MPLSRILSATAFALALAGSASFAPSIVHAGETGWVDSWAASPQAAWGTDFALPTKLPDDISNDTIRQVVRLSLGGSRLRVTFSNAYGETPLVIGAASVGLAADDGAIVAGTLRQLRFGGTGTATVAAGAPLVSDPVDLSVADGARLSVSVHLPGRLTPATFHWDGRQTAHLGDGDQTGSETITATATTDTRILLSGVAVEAENEGTIVAIGDSITDGNGATVDADSRWPDFLAARLAARKIAVVNAGISGGRLLSDGMGESALARFGRDVLGVAGVRSAIVLVGINDIAWPGTAFAPHARRPTAEEIVAGYRQLVAQAHARGVRVVGGTLPPFEGALEGTPLGDYHAPEKDAVRRAVNELIRAGDVFDSIVDFDAALRDPADPDRLTPAFDSGDHLHPGDAGNRAMAEAVDLDALLAN